MNAIFNLIRYTLLFPILAIYSTIFLIYALLSWILTPREARNDWEITKQALLDTWRPIK